MKKLLLTCSIAFATLLTGCLVTSPQKQQIRIDEVPMYGGMDRSVIPEVKAADEKFISDVSAQFGSREKASLIWVNQGFKFYQENKLGMAMRRFNQAWLLNPKNPEVYAGIASILNDQGKSCAAAEQMETALSLNPPKYQGIYSDAGYINAMCAVNEKPQDSEDRQRFLDRSEQIFINAEAVELNKGYLYGLWARAYFRQGKTLESKQMIARQIEAGGKPDANLVANIEYKLKDKN
jgi:tetratricopeptide (TPR) repeat protein